MSLRRVPFVFGLLLAVLILGVSALPTEAKHALHTQGALHSWLHLLSFGALSFALLSSMRSDLPRVLLVVALLLFGYATEAHESHKNGWPVEVKDVRSDSIGVLGGAVLALLCFSGNKG